MRRLKLFYYSIDFLLTRQQPAKNTFGGVFDYGATLTFYIAVTFFTISPEKSKKGSEMFREPELTVGPELTDGGA